MEYPVTQTALLNFFREKTSRPLLLKELLHQLPLPKEESRSLKKMLRKMVREGILVKTHRDRYGLPGKMNLLTGTLQGHPDGYGFLIPEHEEEQDVYIPARAMEGAMHGDKVIVRIEQYKSLGRREGRITKILERHYAKVVGRYEQTRNIGVVVPYEKRISNDFYITPKPSLRAQDGDMVVAEILEYPTRHRNAVVRIVEILGRSSDPRLDTDLIIENYGILNVFSSETLQEAKAISEEIPQKEIADRRDLRRMTAITIDGETAKDFDDAVSAQRLPDGMIRLWVHIADVGHYVAWNGALDREAYLRGTSVYFPDRAVPMLPPKLSNQICSLNPNEDRLTLTCEMVFDTDGTRTDYGLYESLIQSCGRLTYTEAYAILKNGAPGTEKRPDKIIGLLQILEELAARLNRKRKERGSIDFDLPEPEIVLDLQGHPSDILRQERNTAHRIIEECMLAANETVAEHMTNMEVPFIYRIHEEPDPDKMAEFNEYIQSFGFHIKGPAKLKPKSLQNLLEQAKGTPVEKLINHIMLRSMRQARYSPEPKGHFGLAAQHYTHFTSPIRRYPDLVVHRLLKETFQGGRFSPKRQQTLRQTLPDIAKHASDQERIAMEAEREVIDLKKIRFMSDKVGEEFDAFITGVQGFGFFVELEQYFVEGLVHVSSLQDDYYVYLEKQHSLIGEHHRRTFRIGEKVRVQVERVDLERRRIELLLVDQGPKKLKIIKKRSLKKPRNKTR